MPRPATRQPPPFTGRLRPRRQLTIPKTLCDTVGLHEGDLVEAAVEGNKITLTAKSLIDARLDEALADV